MEPSTCRPTGTRSRSSRPRRRTGCRSSCPCVMHGWPSPRSPTTAGTPAVMAADLSTTPRSGIIVQASGDAHLSNFGLFASPERQLVFDANDFDETLPGPWEWDVKRLAASMLIAARSNEFTAAEGRSTVLATVREYREAQAALRRDAPPRDLVRPDDVKIDPGRDDRRTWTTRRASIRSRRRARLDAMFAKARSKDMLRAVDSLTAVVDDHWRIVDEPPVDLPRRDPGRTDGARRDLRRLPGEPRREPARAGRALPVRGFRVEGGRGRQRRDALLHRPARGP